MTKTAMESLIEELIPFIDNSKTTPMAVYLIIQEHLDMERAQIESAFTQGDLFSADYFDGINTESANYFNQTFGAENN